MALVLAVSTTAGLPALVGPAGSAEAAAAPSCGGREVRTLTFDAGTIRVHRKGGRSVCAVFVPEKAGKPGTLTSRKASVQMRAWAGRWGRNKNNPAGSVTVHAGKRGVWIHARVGSRTYDSGRILC